MHPRHAARAFARRSLARDERGVVSIEFALVLPLLLVVIFAIVDLSRAFSYKADANQIAANGARFAAVDNNPGGGSLQDYLRLQAETQELREGGSKAITDPIQVCIETNGGTVGEPVTVTTTFTFKTHALLGGIEKEIKGEATMRIERPPTTYADGCS